MKTPHISAVTLTDFNKQNTTHVLFPGVNVVIGANGTGKTSIWQAIEWVTSGKVTGLPKTNKDIMAACGSKLRMSAGVTVRDTDGNLVAVAREFKRTAKGGVTSTTTADKDRPLITPVCLSLEPFNNATAKERAAMIVGACGADLFTILDQSYLDSGLSKFISIQPTETVHEWIEMVNENAGVRAKLLRADVENMTGLLRGSETLEADPPVWSGPALSAIMADIQAKRRAVDQLTGQITVLQRTARPVLPTYPEPTLKGTLEERQATEAKLNTDAQALETEIRDMGSIISAHNKWTNVRTQLRLNLQDAQNELAELPETPELQAILEEQQQAFIALQAVNGKLKTAASDVLFGKETCPCCGSPKSAWDETKKDTPDNEVVQSWHAESRALSERLAELKESASYAHARSKAKDNVLLRQELLAAHEASSPHAPTGDTEAIGLFNERLNVIHEQLSDIARDRDAAIMWDDYRKAVLTYDKAMAAITEAQVSIFAIEAEIAALEVSRAAAAETAQARADIEARARQREAAMERLKEKEDSLAKLVAASAKFNTEIKAKLGEALRPVIAGCRTFGTGLFPSDLTVNDDLEIGYLDGLVWTGYDAMNASNKRIATIAIQAALAAKGEGIKAVCIDEFGVVDDNRKEQVLLNLNKACESGLLHQVLVLDNRMPPCSLANYNVLHLV